MTERIDNTEKLATVPKEIRDALTFLEYGISNKEKNRVSLERYLQLFNNTTLKEETKRDIGRVGTIMFVDGMKYALGLIEAGQIRERQTAFLVGIECLLATVIAPEIFSNSPLAPRSLIKE